ncbi:MAG: two-component system response regulator RppA [Candidatus Dormiibacterota bacterium]|jgi:DNA-binding response OmpR family regulator|nr:two-component system response regulator RppA [Candidatus Dormibacteraeota bacterium]
MRLLIVEDERKLARLLQGLLEDENHAVDVAYDGDEGLDFVRAGDYDLIILDVLLPGVDGLEVCRRVRAMKVRTPILMLTARTSVDDRVAGLDAGADDYLTKPFAFAELMARIRALSRREVPDSVGNRLQVGELSLDVKTREVRMGERRIDLTPKEFALLEYFMRHPNQVLTGQQIADHVWSYDFDGLTNRVAVYVSYLRRKLESNEDKAPIQTVHGVGYRLVAST